ncbi:hypothetical protein [Mesobacillus stamsii]|uniref:Uncharacterized protein n=1 Tax=Mesobacillus stamsii TaxID=225347 RepID=A0ABU0FSH7_9BACI|nr:hypothetical protein [Mesobacillus stamsii]MDQ0412882.1 hypothetical protein [Mesobacillus stamsii]
MIIELSRVEMAVLSVNMAALRKNVRKGFKSNFGKQEGQEKLEVYDEIKAALNDGIEKTEEEQKRELHFNKYEIDMLNDFVPWYLLELEVTYETAGKKLKGEDKKVMETLQGIKEKIERVIENYA